MNDLDDLGKRYREWPEVKALIAELREVREAAQAFALAYSGMIAAQAAGVACHPLALLHTYQELHKLLWPADEERDR